MLKIHGIVLFVEICAISALQEPYMTLDINILHDLYVLAGPCRLVKGEWPRLLFIYPSSSWLKYCVHYMIGPVVLG